MFLPGICFWVTVANAVWRAFLDRVFPLVPPSQFNRSSVGADFKAIGLSEGVFALIHLPGIEVLPLCSPGQFVHSKQKEPGATDRDRGLMARHRRKLTLHSGRRMCNPLSYFSMKRGSDRELLEPTGEPKKTPTKLSGATAFWSGDRDAFGRQTERVCLLGKDGCQVLPVEGIGLDMIFNPPKPGIPRK